MRDNSPEAMAARAEARRKTTTIKAYRLGEEPEVDEDILAMAPHERFELGLRLTCMAFNIAERNNAEFQRSGGRLPRSAWPIHIVRR